MKGILYTGGCIVIGMGLAFWKAESYAPGVTQKSTQDAVHTGVPMVRGLGVMGGETLRATGPVMAGATDALQSSGLGSMLTTTTVEGGGLSPAGDAPAPNTP